MLAKLNGTWNDPEYGIVSWDDDELGFEMVDSAADGYQKIANFYYGIPAHLVMRPFGTWQAII